MFGRGAGKGLAYYFKMPWSPSTGGDDERALATYREIVEKSTERIGPGPIASILQATYDAVKRRIHSDKPAGRYRE